MVYLDTSTLLKLLWLEPESEAVRFGVAAEDAVIVSSLVELETEVQLKAAWLGGRYRETQGRRFHAKLAELRDLEPFQFRILPGSLFETALRQHASAGRTHCRTLDRLYLAAMAELDLARLRTHDDVQAEAGRRLGFEIAQPGR